MSLLSYVIEVGCTANQFNAAMSPVSSTNLTNALCAVGTKLYIGMWYLSGAATAGGEIIEYDTVTKKGVKLMDLPLGKYKGTGTSNYSFGIVNMHATSTGNHIEGNVVVSNDRGIDSGTIASL